MGKNKNSCPSLTDIPRFLLISLTMDAVLEETTAYGRRQRLKTSPEGLDLRGVYDATLERIKEQDGDKTRLGVAALIWTSHSERLLQLDELSHALAVEIGSTSLNPENIPSVELLLSSCLGLIIVDRETSIVRFIHYTLQEYLHTCPNLFGPTHSIMAETCLTYLNFGTIKHISPRLFSRPQKTPFLRYSSLYWGVHARREATSHVVSLALQLFSQIESHISTKLLLADLISATGRSSRGIPTNDPLARFTGLHCASIFGIVEVATCLMEYPNYDLNGRDSLGITPLIWAAIYGHEGVAQVLLEQATVNPDEPDGYFRQTALSWAARKGHEGIVRLLLGWATAEPDDIPVNIWRGKTPRVLNGVGRMRHVDPNWLDKYGQTPMLLAAEEGNWGVLQLLLERKDIKAGKSDNRGRIPLHCAALHGHEGVVQALLERGDVNPDKPTDGGRTPLSFAAWNGHEEVVKILLKLDDVNPDGADRSGETPLCYAAENGHEGVVRILLERGDVNPNKADNGRTPLSSAARNGHEGVVGILLERDDVNPDKVDNSGRKPLNWAAQNRHTGVINILLARGDIGPDKPDDFV